MWTTLHSKLTKMGKICQNRNLKPTICTRMWKDSQMEWKVNFQIIRIMCQKMTPPTLVQPIKMEGWTGSKTIQQWVKQGAVMTTWSGEERTLHEKIVSKGGVQKKIKKPPQMFQVLWKITKMRNQPINRQLRSMCKFQTKLIFKIRQLLSVLTKISRNCTMQTSLANSLISQCHSLKMRTSFLTLKKMCVSLTTKTKLSCVTTRVAVKSSPGTNVKVWLKSRQFTKQRRKGWEISREGRLYPIRPSRLTWIGTDWRLSDALPNHLSTTPSKCHLWTMKEQKSIRREKATEWEDF